MVDTEEGAPAVVANAVGDGNGPPDAALRLMPVVMAILAEQLESVTAEYGDVDIVIARHNTNDFYFGVLNFVVRATYVATERDRGWLFQWSKAEASLPPRELVVRERFDVGNAAAERLEHGEKCPICQESGLQINEPVRTSCCRSMFCAPCLRNYLARGATQCATCRKPMEYAVRIPVREEPASESVVAETSEPSSFNSYKRRRI